MSNDEETEQFDDAQPIVHVGNLQTVDTNVKTHSAVSFDDDSCSGAAESLSTHVTARDGTKWESMEKIRGRSTRKASSSECPY